MLCEFERQSVWLRHISRCYASNLALGLECTSTSRLRKEKSRCTSLSNYVAQVEDALLNLEAGLGMRRSSNPSFVARNLSFCLATLWGAPSWRLTGCIAKVSTRGCLHRRPGSAREKEGYGRQSAGSNPAVSGASDELLCSCCRTDSTN